MDPQTDNKSFITKLYVDEAEGTKSLYSDIGFSMRMELWDMIDVEKWIELSEDCRQDMPGCNAKAQDFFDRIIDDMNARIKGMDSQKRAQLIFNRNSLQEKYSKKPVNFAHAMAASFELENQLISHYRNHLESQTSSTEENPSFVNDSAISESEKILQAFKYSLQDLLQFKNGNHEILIGNVQSGIAPESLREAALDLAYKLVQSLQVSWEKVKDTIAIALQADAYRNISLTPKHSVSYEDLSFLCDRHAAMLDELYTGLNHSNYNWLLGLNAAKYQEVQKALNLLIQSFFERNMVFIKHPKEVILVANNEKKGEKDVKTEETTACASSKGKKGHKNASKEKGKVFDSKKKESIDAKVRILGLTKMRDSVVLSHSLILTTEQHLAGRENPLQNLEYDGAQSPQPQNCGTIYPIPTELPCLGETEFKNLKIEGYERASDSVYEQMLRLQYTVNIQAFNQNYVLKAYSLPFFLCTGAIQVLELLGSRMWYLANNPDLFHGNFRVIATLPIADVINMLENRIKHTCPNKRRGLSFHGREFFKERIPEIDNEGRISLHTFIKDKLKEIPDRRNSAEEVKYHKFTFFAWFYAFVKSIENHPGLWHDWIIYDLFSYRDSCEFLLREKYSSGCVLIRPGLSKIITPNSLDAHIRFTADMKVRSGGKWKVSTIPIDPEQFESSSLYTMISLSGYGDIKPKSIVTCRGTLPLSVLENYDDRKKIEVIRYHDYIIKKTEFLHIKSDDNKADEAMEEQFDTGKRKRKEARHDSDSSFVEPLSSLLSVEPSEPCEMRTSDTDFCLNAVSPNSIVSDKERQTFSPPNDSDSVKTESNVNSSWHVYGRSFVDISHLRQLKNQYAQSPLASPENCVITSPHTYSIIECDYPEQVSPEQVTASSVDGSPTTIPRYSPEQVMGFCMDGSPTTIPTTVQEIEVVNDPHMPTNLIPMEAFDPNSCNSRFLSLPPGWTEKDVIETLKDQGIASII